mgnify:CR=1 FL=1
MHIAVIGAGIVGVSTAAYLQRDGHVVTIIDPLDAGEACSFGNAGSLSPSACLPVGMPGMWKKVPKWILDPMGPLTIRTAYRPKVAPWLFRFVSHCTKLRTAAATIRRHGTDPAVRLPVCLFITGNGRPVEMGHGPAPQPRCRDARCGS